MLVNTKAEVIFSLTGFPGDLIPGPSLSDSWIERGNHFSLIGAMIRPWLLCSQLERFYGQDSSILPGFVLEQPEHWGREWFVATLMRKIPPSGNCHYCEACSSGLLAGGYLEKGKSDVIIGRGVTSWDYAIHIPSNLSRGSVIGILSPTSHSEYCEITICEA